MDAPVLLAARLPHVLVAEAVVGARAHGRRARTAHGHGRARHASLLPRVLRHARRARRALPAEAHPTRDSDRRRAASRRGPESLGARSRSLLSHPQGRAARRGASAVRRLDLGDPSRPVAEPRGHAEGAVVGALPGLQDPPARRLGREAGVVVHRRQRDTLQPAARCGVPLDRLHPVHPPDDPDDEERAGRWAGSDKLECGIHENTKLERTA